MLSYSGVPLRFDVPSLVCSTCTGPIPLLEYTGPPQTEDSERPSTDQTVPRAVRFVPTPCWDPVTVLPVFPAPRRAQEAKSVRPVRELSRTA